ncbi:MAG: D-alanine--D-alanine ligase [Deltaproteobacteria bacterium]|nr:MAG: D-alanine--D-alanine ligase [Deltaproteobacteria bacterium]
MNKKTIALLSGGISPERNVSLNSGSQVYDALDKDKYDVVRYDPKTDLARLAADAAGIDAALIILHGPYGEDGTIQGMLDLLQIPYQGTGVLGSAVAMDKVVAKQLYEKAGLPTPPYVVLNRGDHAAPSDIVRRLGLPVVVKPARDGSSIGMTIVRRENAIEAALEKAFLQGPVALAEAFIEGVEITGGVLGNDDLEALPLIEIVPDKSRDFFDYEAKYQAGMTEEICPARIDAVLTEKAQHQAIMAHQALFCRGYSRTDMIFSGQTFYVLETNTIPGMTATSLFPQAAAKAGYSFGQLMDRLIDLTLADHRLKTREKPASG